MPDYRRARVEGGCYFFTVVTRHRMPVLIEHISALRHAFRRIKQRHPFLLDAVVVLPDHLHCIMTLPEGDRDFSTRWDLIKSEFSRAVPQTAGEETKPHRGERGIWQRRFWEHVIRNETDFRRHMDYIHYNPVKHAYVLMARDWPYSSFHRYARQGVYANDWGGEGMDDDINQE